MPGVVVAGRSRGNDCGQVLDALPQQCSKGLGMTFVPNRVLCGHGIAGGLDELDREGSERKRSLVG